MILLLFVNRKRYSHPYVAVVQCRNGEWEQKATALLRSHSERCVLKSKTVRDSGVEINYEIRLKKDDTSFINELNALNGVESAVLVSYNGDYMG